ncbi:MAG: peptidoglycan-binding protein [Actinomycetota bacterium]
MRGHDGTGTIDTPGLPRVDDRRDAPDDSRPAPLGAVTITNSDLDGDVPAASTDDDIAEALGTGRRRRRWPWLVAGIGVGVGGTVATSGAWDGDSGSADTTSTETVELTTAAVVAQDLVDSVEYDGDLGRSAAQEILAGADGTITSIVTIGEQLDRGDVIATIDDQPVVAMYGSQPFWRDLESGDEGLDVLQLEANLAALGFDADGAMTVDGDFTSATEDGVEEWEEQLGLDVTGEVPLGRVVVIDGPSIVADAASVSSAARLGQQLALIETERTAFDLVVDGRSVDADAVLTEVVAPGTPVDQGTTLALLDGVAVQAVTESSEVSGPILDAIGDGDVERLENLLVFFGFDPSDAIVVDDEVDLATAAAVIAWQESVGLQPTGATESAYYVESPTGLAVSATHADTETELDGGALLATASASTLAVSMEVVVDEIDDIQLGDAVEIDLADDSTLDGRIISIADVANEPANVDETPTVDVEIEVDEVDEVVLGPVTVRIEVGRIEGAVLVPTRALVSLREGGFAVTVRRADGSEQLVGIELGAFDDGLVEVVSGDVSPGDDVVVPS